jgi:hypothetical protein
MLIVFAPLWALSDRAEREVRAPSSRRLYAVWIPLSLAALFGIVALGWYSVSAHKQAAPSVPHSVTLSWKASVSKGVNYRVYRATRSGGPYTIVQMTPIPGTSFVDSNVQAGETYYYVVTSVDKKANETAFSKEISVKIPTP